MALEVLPHLQTVPFYSRWCLRSLHAPYPKPHKNPSLSIPWEVSEEDPGDPGVDERVADDEDVQEGLPEGAAVLHLPAGLVVAPQVQRVVLLGDQP